MAVRTPMLAVPAVVAALALAVPGTASAITGYAGAANAVAAQYPANSQTPTSPPLVPGQAPSQGNPSSHGAPSQTPSQPGGNGNPTEPTRQFAVSQSPVGSLPFTGYAAIVAIGAALLLLAGGLVARRLGRA